MKEKGLLPKYIVDLKRVPGLSGIRENSDGSITLGALTTMYAIETSPLIETKYPFLAQSAAEVGSIQIRNRATIGGNMPAVIDPQNLYSETRSDKVSPVVAKHLSRVYVPNRTSNDVWVIDPATYKVIDKFKVGRNPQHVVPSWDLKTLWVNNNAEHRTDGSVTPIDPLTGKPGKSIDVDDPYNMYFTPDGRDRKSVV